MKLEIKEEFLERYKKLLGNEVETFIEYLKKPLQKTIRVNTIKIGVEELIKIFEENGIEVEKLKFYDKGLIIKSKVEGLGNSIYHQLGYFYIQEKASMLPPLLMELNENKNLILDLCAAPGSKTSEISQEARNSLIIANEVVKGRANILVSNCRRLGNDNVIITRMDGRKFAKYKEQFDKILVDAPCSSEGAIRKDFSIAKMISLSLIKRLSKLQKELIESAYIALKKGGILIYSTCTLTPEENEEVINYLYKKYNCKIEKIKIKNFKIREGVKYWNYEIEKEVYKNVARIYPQDNDSEGFFIAKIRKV